MKKPRQPQNEAFRLATLQEYNLLDTLPEKDFDNLTRIASQICGTPVSLITLVDQERQWFKSRQGLSVTETPREFAFCAHALLEPDQPLIVPDSTQDERFHHNPLVTGEPYVIFYAGVPLLSEEGYPLGTLCVIDHQPRQLNDEQIAALKALARQASHLMELGRKVAQLERRERELEAARSELTQFNYMLTHDIKSPVSNIAGLLENLHADLSARLTDEERLPLDLVRESVAALQNLVDGTLRYYQQSQLKQASPEAVALPDLLQQILQLLPPPAHIELRYSSDLPTIRANRFALEKILFNLIDNAIKYHDKPSGGWVAVSLEEREFHYHLQVSDNGRGIHPAEQAKIFNLFENLRNRDHRHQQGTGIGLALVQKTVRQLQGEISVESTPGEGTTFSIRLPR